MYSWDVEKSEEVEESEQDDATATDIGELDPKTLLDAKVHPMLTNSQLLGMIDRASVNRKDGKKNLWTKAEEMFTRRGELKVPYKYLITLGVGRNPEDALTQE
jgi:hypothetical protein